MSEHRQTPPDPLDSWKRMRDSWMEGWSKLMSEGVQTPEYAKAMGQWMDLWFSAGGPLRKQVEEFAERYLDQMNLPSRSEMMSVSRRLTGLERRLDDLEAKADEILDRLADLAAREADAPRPKRRTSRAAKQDKAQV